MSRLRIPEFINDVVRDPGQRGILIAGSLSLFAVGMVPHVLVPGLPDAQRALKAQPEVENLFLLLSFAAAATIIVGGLISDLFRRRSLLVGGLVVMIAAAVVSIIVDDGPIFYAANFAAVAASGVVLAYGIGSVAIAYEGIPRGTALGFVYAAYGAAAALAPALLTLLVVDDPSRSVDGPYRLGSGFRQFETWLAYLAGAITAAVAVWAALRWIPRLPGKLPAPRPLVIGAAAWSISILAIVSGVLGLGIPGGALLPVALIVGGALGLSTSTFRFKRSTELLGGLSFDRRALGTALVVGVVVGVAQAVPLLLLPVVFQYPLQYGALFALLAIAPFAVALFLAGPMSGYLLQRFGPRDLMTFGTLSLGVANILLALVLAVGGLGSQYVAFIVPLALIGAGFVLSTTVRTAVVFASTPRGLPASAAAINEASVSLGSRIGIVGATTVVALTALESARSRVAGLPDAEALVDEFGGVLVALGTPGYGSAIQGVALQKLPAYATAYIDGVVVALVASGVIGIAGAVLAWFLTGRRDPLHTVFDLQDERETTVSKSA